MLQLRDNLSSEVKILKEKSQPELLHELHERFYDKPAYVVGRIMMKAFLTIVRSMEGFI